MIVLLTRAINSPIPLFNMYLLQLYCMPGIELGVGDFLLTQNWYDLFIHGVDRLMFVCQQ